MSDSKYHISADGKAAPCHAIERPCPLGGEHYPTQNAAETASLQNKIKSLLGSVPPEVAKEVSGALQEAYHHGYNTAEEDHHGTGFWAQNRRADPVKRTVSELANASRPGPASAEAGSVLLELLDINDDAEALEEIGYTEHDRQEAYSVIADPGYNPQDPEKVADLLGDLLDVEYDEDEFTVPPGSREAASTWLTQYRTYWASTQ